MGKNKLILLVIILLGCIAIGGVYYASKINKQKLIEAVVSPQEHSKQVDKNLIQGNFDQLVLSEKDVQERMGFVKLNKELSKEIKNITELSELTLFESDKFNKTTDIEYNIIGGYRSEFDVDTETVFERPENDESTRESLMANNLSHRVIVFNTENEAKTVFEDFKNKVTAGAKELVAEGVVTKVDDLIISLESLGLDGLRYDLFGNIIDMDGNFAAYYFFRINNYVNILEISGDGKKFTEEDILYFLEKIKQKPASYTPPAEDIKVVNYSLDTDSDGLVDYLEERLGTEKNNPDTDGDGYIDGEELNDCYDPLAAKGVKLIKDELTQKLKDGKFMKSQGLYIPEPGEDIFKLMKSEDISKNFYPLWSAPDLLMTGVFAEERERYYMIYSKLGMDEIYFNGDGSLEIICSYADQYFAKLTAQEVEKCQRLNDANNFEIDCKRSLK